VDFRIADTFTASLARLNGSEQKAVKTTAFDLQLNQSSPGLRFHRLDRHRDPNFWSVRVNDDIRLLCRPNSRNYRRLLCLWWLGWKRCFYVDDEVL
jgi:mRNA-degrading endonuclease RelE of RelBE toxin-antitoxin system